MSDEANVKRSDWELLIFGGKHPTEYFRVRNIETGENAPGVEVVARDTLRLVDLKFTIRDFTHDTGARYLRRTRSAPGNLSVMIVEFPPQHLAESILDPVPAPGKSSGVGQHFGRLAGLSRICFTIDPSVDRLQVKLNGTGGLLDWSRSLQVHPRASARAGTELARQLEIAFGRADLGETKLATAIDAISRGFTAPSADQTALEMSGRLLFSPDESANWQLTPLDGKELKDGVPTVVPLWSARLDRAGRRSVRAIWSRYFQDGVIPEFPTDTSPPPGQAASEPDVLPLSRRDHWQIVGQTSVYGLPALRRLKSSLDDEPRQVRLGARKDALTDAPNGSVVRPAVKIGFLDQIDHVEFGDKHDSGIAIAKPFRDADIMLTALGGIFTAEWKGEPPRLLPKQLEDGSSPLKAPWSGFDLERLAYRSWLGRDSHVVAVYKGFLFPLGVRASYLKVHERQLIEEGGELVSRLVRRYFIVTPGSRRPFPGPYHPYDARDFPVGSLQMKTLVTPDLRDPLEGAVVKIDNGSEAAAFWPRIKGGSDDAYVKFEWMTDDGAVATSPLIFVINTIVDWPTEMTRVAENYKSDEARRKARFSGARTRYAPRFDYKSEGGDSKRTILETSYDTHEWLLDVRNRIDGDSPFRMDGRMEGADQPPFYPFVERATIGVQSLDRQLGQSNGQYDVGFHALYRDHGFAGIAAHEVYLEFTGSPADMDCTKDVRKAGALVKQRANIQALSRLTGLVGAGEKSAAVPLGQRGDPLQDVLAGVFNPASFFNEASLFGIVNIKDVLPENLSFKDNAPSTVESIDYGAAPVPGMTEVDVLAPIRAVAADALALLGRINAPIRDWLKDEVANSNVTHGQLYESLSARLVDFLDDAPDSLQTLRGVTKVADVAKPAKALLDLLRPLLLELERIVEDPVPQKFRGMLGQVLELHNLRAILSGDVRSLAPMARAGLARWFAATFGSVPADFGELLFGRPLELSDLDDLRIALDSADRSPFQSVFSGSLQALAAEFEYACDGDAWRALEAAVLTRLPRRVPGLMADSLQLVDSVELIDPAPTDDLRHESVREAIATRFVESVRVVVIGPLEQKHALQDLIDHVDELCNSLSDQLEPAFAQMLAEIRQSIYPLDPADPHGIKDRLANSISRSWSDLLEVLDHGLDVLHATLLAVKARQADAITQVRGLGTRLLKCWIDSSLLAEIARNCAVAAAQLDTVATQLTTAITASIDSAIVQLDAVIAAVDAEVVQLGGPLLRSLAAQLRALRSVLAAFQQETDPTFVFEFANRPREGLREFDRYLRLRRDVAKSLQTIAQSMLDLAGAADPAWIEARTMECARLFLQLLGIELLQTATPSISAYLSALPQVPALVDHRKHIQEALYQALNLAGNLQTTLVNPTPQALLDATSQSRAYLDALDRKLSASFLQAAAFSQQVVGDLTHGAADSIRALTRPELVPPITCLHAALAKAFIGVAESADNPVVLLVLELIAPGHPDLPTELRARAQSLLREAAFIHGLSTAANDNTVIEGATKWLQGKSELAFAAELILDIRIDDIGQRFVQSVLAGLEELLRSARALAQAFLPTRLTTSYSWEANLQAFPKDNWIFDMDDSTSADGEKHLQLSSTFDFDAATGVSTTNISGTLKPFKLRLIGDFELAIIHFTGATFTSTNGASANFNVKVSSVEIGKELQYLKALQDWMSPAKNGFYLKPDLLGIEAGYHYEAGLIQLGNLQFINVAFNVAARLYFDGTPAEFEFKFADAARPFLIAAPPYGGGGWLRLVANAQGVKEFEMSFVFGGVAALEFGPLHAQGRIVAGVTIRVDKVKGDHILEAIFEAVGEGSIACFSVSVFIRITLTQVNGNLNGRAIYGFSFRVGFAEFSYQVEARYTLSGGKGAQQLASRSTPRSALASPLQSKMEAKATEWPAYCSHFSMELV